MGEDKTTARHGPAARLEVLGIVQGPADEVRRLTDDPAARAEAAASLRRWQDRKGRKVRSFEMKGATS